MMILKQVALPFDSLQRNFFWRKILLRHKLQSLLRQFNPWVRDYEAFNKIVYPLIENNYKDMCGRFRVSEALGGFIYEQYLFSDRLPQQAWAKKNHPAALKEGLAKNFLLLRQGQVLLTLRGLNLLSNFNLLNRPLYREALDKYLRAELISEGCLKFLLKYFDLLSPGLNKLQIAAADRTIYLKGLKQNTIITKQNLVQLTPRGKYALSKALRGINKLDLLEHRFALSRELGAFVKNKFSPDNLSLALSKPEQASPLVEQGIEKNIFILKGNKLILTELGIVLLYAALMF